jgi:glycosyltransferase involved in cell wall biosynthesis
VTPILESPLGVVRVQIPDLPAPPWDTWIRSGTRVWSHLRAELPAPGVEIVTSEPDVWLWDGHGELPETDKPIVALLHEAPGESEGLAQTLVDYTDRVGRVVANRAERVVTCSSASRRRISERYGIELERIDAAPYGVDMATFRPDGPTAKQPILDGGGDTRPYVLFVGTVLPRKNLPLLREAMIELPTHQLVLVASPCVDPDSAALLKAATDPIDGRPVANLRGIDDDGLAALMRGADVLCLPSLSEGFGLPVIEAMACGTPVVVSDRGALSEIAGDGGVIVSPTRDGIVRGVNEALAHRSVLSERARRRAQEFTWARTAAAIRRTLFRVVGTNAMSSAIAGNG